MSGSPILQNGKLIGSVTHAPYDDPTTGYGVYAESMLETAQSVSEQQLKEAKIKARGVHIKQPNEEMKQMIKDET